MADIHYSCKEQIKKAKKLIALAIKGDVNDEIVQQAKLHAAALLKRSVCLQHDRLAVERFRIAVLINAPIDTSSLDYCRKLILDYENLNTKK